jgi:alpha-ribazole phosphatase
LAIIYLVRHGETSWNKENLFQGQSDIDLNETGIQQAEKLRNHLNGEKIDTIYSSDLKRAMTTANIIASGHNINVIPCLELREMSFGELEGKDITECLSNPRTSQWWDSHDPTCPPPGGESVSQFTRRVSQFYNRIDLYSDKTYMVVSHGGTVRALICSLLGFDDKFWWQFRCSHTSLSMIDASQKRGVVLALLNDTSHLNK